MTDDVPTLVNVLTLLAQGGGLGVVLAFLLEKVSWFQNLESNAKWWFIFAISLGVPLLAQVIIQFVPPDVLETLEPFWHTLALGFLAWAGSQGMHLIHKRLK